MKLFLKHSIIFLALFFVFEKSSYYVLCKAPQKEIDKRLEYVINSKVNKEVIVLGSSRGAGNILAGQIEKETGLSSYNLSYQGTNIEFHNFILKTLLKFNKPPKKILLSIDSPHAFFKEKSLEFRTEYLIPLAANNHINNELIKRGNNSLISKFFYLGRINTSNFNFKQKTNRPNNPINSYGSMPLLKLSEKDKPLVFTVNKNEYNKNIESKSKVGAFKNIQQLCKNNNIELICVFSPSFRTFNNKFLERFKTLLLPENDLFVYDLERDIYTNTDYFYDNAHLNVVGAKNFTSELNIFINQNKEN